MHYRENKSYQYSVCPKDSKTAHHGESPLIYNGNAKWHNKHKRQFADFLHKINTLLPWDPILYSLVFTFVSPKVAPGTDLTGVAREGRKDKKGRHSERKLVFGGLSSEKDQHICFIQLNRCMVI